MFGFIQKTLNYLWKYKKIFFLFSVFTLLIFIIRFPWNQSIEKIVRISQKNMPMEIQFEEVNLDLFPPGISFNQLSVNHGLFSSPFSLDRLSLSLALEKWLLFNKGFRFKGRQGRSTVTVTFSMEEKGRERDKSSYVSLEAFSSFLDLTVLAPILGDFRIKGFTLFNVEYEGSFSDLEQAEGKLYLKGNQLEILSSQLDTDLGEIQIPDFKWTQAKAQLRLEDGTVFFESLVLGSDTDDLYLRLRGQVDLIQGYNKIRFNSYDFQTRIEIAQGVDFKFIDLMLAKTKEIQKNKTIYKARITGQGSKPPNIEALKEF